MKNYKNLLKVDKKRVEKRISEIEKRVVRLRRLLKEHNETDFLVDQDVADLADRNLQITIQACLDIADHFISVFGLELPKEDKKEVFPILARESVIKERLVKKLVDMAGMRNILVHDYTEVQRDEVYKTIKHDLGDIESFVSQIQKFLDKIKNSKR